MKPVDRSQILDYVTYEEQREGIRAEALAAKAPRRLSVGEYMTFLFDNATTVRYQVLEMVRTERLVKEADIVHELATYNEFIGPKGTLCATLLIAIEGEAERQVKLRAWMGLLDHLYATLADGQRVRPSWDPRQVGEERLSSVQYLSFEFGAQAPVAIGVDWPERELVVEHALTDEQRAALQADLDAE